MKAYPHSTSPGAPTTSSRAALVSRLQASRTLATWARTVGLGAVFLFLLHLVLAASVMAQSGGPYELTSWTVDGGGETLSTGGGYSLAGTAGQPDAGLLSGGGYTLGGGFWGSGSAIPIDYEYDTYLPLVLR
jgi:hypothetical protein